MHRDDVYGEVGSKQEPKGLALYPMGHRVPLKSWSWHGGGHNKASVLKMSPLAAVWKMALNK